MSLAIEAQSRLAEVAILAGVVVCAWVFIFWDIGQAGGVHWENYECAFYAGLVGSGQVEARELWRMLGVHNSPMAFPCAVYSLLNALFGIGYAAAGVLKMDAILAVWTVAFTCLLGRLCFGRGTGVTAAVLLASCPLFITHVFSGHYSSFLNVAAAVPCVLLFVWAHRARSPLILLGSAYALSWSYLAAYVSFPILMLAFLATLLLTAIFRRQELLPMRWYAAWAALIVVSILVNGALVSVLYCGQEPLYVVEGMELRSSGVLWPIRKFLGDVPAAAPSGLRGDQMAANVLNMVMEVFVRSSPAYKTFTPSIPAAVVPFDHMGANLPGSATVLPVVTVLLIAGVVATVVARRFDMTVITLVWVILLAVISVALSFQTRRVVFAAPFMMTTAAFGLSWAAGWLFGKRPRLERAVLWLLPAAVLAYAAFSFKPRFQEHLRTLQFDCFADVGRFLTQKIDPAKDFLVVLDKSVMQPTAVYMETNFRTYRLAYLSEFYFPVLLACDTGNLEPLRDEPYSYQLKHLPHLYRYCNLPFPPRPFDLPPAVCDTAWAHFSTQVRTEARRGGTIWLLASLAEEKSIETGGQYLYEFLLMELARRNVRLEKAADFGVQPSGRPHVIAFKMTLPNG